MKKKHEHELNKEQESNNPFAEEAKTEQAEPDERKDKMQEELDTLKNQYLRLAADFDNYRKRQEQERGALLKYGAEETLKKLLPILDTFERAQKSIVELDDIDKVKESFDVVKKQFAETLEKIGLEKIETNGQQFDPNYHEAVMQTPSNDHEENKVIAELQSGYKLGDKVIRAALVNVAVKE